MTANSSQLRLAYTVSALALCAAISGTATPVRAETLQDVLAATYRYNPRLDAARAALRATDEEVARANSGYRPNISASADSGSVWTTSKLAAGTSASSETHPSGYGVTSSQPLFRGFRTLNTVREAEATIRAGRENLRIVEQSVLLEAITAYMDTLRDGAIVKIRENNVEVLSRELRATQERFKVGEVTRTDVAQAEARRAGSVSALDLARSNLKISRGNFERTVGRPPGNLAEPRPPKGRLPKSLQEAIGISSRESPTIIAALYREQGARSTVDRIWGELLPTVQIDSSYSRRFDVSTTVAETETTSVVARATIPLYTTGEVQARVRQAKHTHVSRIQEIEQNRSDVQALVVQAWSQLQAADAQFISDTSQVKALSIALAGVREEEKVGQRTLLDILNAEQELLNAQVNLATTRRNINVTSYSVLSTVGRLNIQELGAADEVYDAELHYHEIRRKWWGISITHAHGRTERYDFWERLGQVFHAAHGETVTPPAKPVGKWKPAK
jgi:outer membrane protein